MKKLTVITMLIGLLGLVACSDTSVNSRTYAGGGSGTATSGTDNSSHPGN